jgi:hypothetical protein
MLQWKLSVIKSGGDTEDSIVVPTINDHKELCFFIGDINPDKIVGIKAEISPEQSAEPFPK